MIEVCCGSASDALAAWRGGARRIELNSALELGGLTPSVASLRLVRESTGLEVVVMARPRGGGFCYGGLEWRQLLDEATMLLEEGADGIAFGALDAPRHLDEARTAQMVSLVHSYGATVVFHRAFDLVDEPLAAARLLVGLGVDRLLTSGQRHTAWEGRELIRELQVQLGDELQILPGSGVNAGNARDLREFTGVGQLHSSCRALVDDAAASGRDVSFAVQGDADVARRYQVSEELVRALVATETA